MKMQFKTVGIPRRGVRNCGGHGSAVSRAPLGAAAARACRPRRAVLARAGSFGGGFGGAGGGAGGFGGGGFGGGGMPDPGPAMASVFCGVLGAAVSESGKKLEPQSKAPTPLAPCWGGRSGCDSDSEDYDSPRSRRAAGRWGGDGSDDDACELGA